MVKQIILIRKDFKVCKGRMIAHGAHASQKVLLDLAVKDRHSLYLSLNSEFDEWINGIFTKVVLGVESEDELLAIIKQADDIGEPNSSKNE